MWDNCPICGLKFEREQGYFLGAMYISYGLSIPPVLLLILAIRMATGWPFDWSIGAAFLVYLPFVPFMARLARVVWIYLDQSFDPR